MGAAEELATSSLRSLVSALEFISGDDSTDVEAGALSLARGIAG
jgi:hypothetical protein